MLCVVTGAAGFIGSTLCDRLLAQGATVRGIDAFVNYYPREAKLRNLKSALSNPRFSLLEANLAQADLPRLLDGADVVFHQAAQAGVRASWGSYFSSYCEHNILSTQRLLEACLGSKTIKRIVYASSSSVYGNAETYPTKESLVPQPVSPYGVTKLAAEHLMCLYASEYGLPTVSLRYFTVYGPRQRPDMAFHRFARAALQGDEILIYGDGEQCRDFTFIDDIVSANIQAVEAPTAGAVYNLGGGTQSTVNQVLDVFAQHLGPLKVKRVERQLGDARRTSADTTKARTEIGFSPKVNLGEGIAREIAWMREILAA
jgi:nucleoside-diphosphate-sugar epimerase